MFNSMCRPTPYCNLNITQLMSSIENQSINLNIDVDSLITWMNMSEKKTLNFVNFLKMS